MIEFNPKPTETPSLNAVEASVNRTVSDRFKGLGEKAKNVGRMVTKRSALNVGALALLISSGCSNVGQPDVLPTPTEPTHVSTPTIVPTEASIATSTAEAVKTPEKEALTDIEFVSNLLGKYLDLDADPRWKKLKDLNYLGSGLSKVIEQDLRYPDRLRSHEVPLGAFNLDYPGYDGTAISYNIPSAFLSIGVYKGPQGAIKASMSFLMDKEGNLIFGEDSISREGLWPGRYKAARLVLSGTGNAARFLRNKPNEWVMVKRDFDLDKGGPYCSIDSHPKERMLRSIGMFSNVVLPNGENIEYRVSTSSTRVLPLIVHFNTPITTGR